jgi:hypothetical protein
MAKKAVVEAVSARLAANWDENLAAIYDANSQTSTPAGGEPFLVLQFPVADTERLPVNNRYYREEGAFRVVIHTEAGAGADKALEWGDQIAAIFRDQEFDGVVCLVPTSPLTHDDNEDGNYFVTSVVCPYRYDFAD